MQLDTGVAAGRACFCTNSSIICSAHTPLSARACALTNVHTCLLRCTPVCELRYLETDLPLQVIAGEAMMLPAPTMAALIEAAKVDQVREKKGMCACGLCVCGLALR